MTAPSFRTSALPSSALYVGSVNHRRLRPVSHHLRYRMFWLLVDLDELPALDKGLRLFSHNRFNLFSFHDRDFGPRDGTKLRDWIDGELAASGIRAERVELLCMPRILGYGFNPISVFFCYGDDGAIAAILYEVHNTFGERHAYLATIDGEAGTLRHDGEKHFYVSPFMDMTMRYAFRVEPPGEKLGLAIKGSDADGPLIAAALAARRRDLTDGALAKIFATHPLLTLKVIAAIHWHALRLWWKGVTLTTKPAPGNELTTLNQARRGRT